MPTCQWHSPISTRASFRPRSSPATSRAFRPPPTAPARSSWRRTSPIAGASAMISGEIDLLLTTTPGEYERLVKADGVKALRTPSGQFLNINLGCDQKPFNDVRVRQALALAVDREATVGFVAGGYGTPGNDTPLSSAYHFYKNIPLKKPDIDKAKKLLADAGYPNGIDLTLVASDRP